jgi:hypothetical protein
VDAHLDRELSRGLWLVKWLLALPHYLILAFLWLAFVVLSVMAFVAILFTGRYPRSIFEFNVGVLRWSWRVAYYAYGALGTDRYPPFTLREHPGYPAHLEVDYPAHLSRGLVLVKWWLFAIPHYLVVAFFVGGGLFAVDRAGAGANAPELWGGGLIGLLVLVAGVVLLFTGRYPQQIFDFVLGMNRWALRVAGYAALMTDVYPPFRLDQGGDDPGSSRLVVSPTTAPAPATTPASEAGTGTASALAAPSANAPAPVWTGGRVVGLVIGTLVLLASIGAGLAGAALGVAGAAMRDDTGFLMRGSQAIATPGYALTSTNIELHANGPAQHMPRAVLGDAKITATAKRGTPLFVGIATTPDVATYLSHVRHATVVRLDPNPVYRTSGGHAPVTSPGAQDIWVAQATGTGPQSVVWPVERGDWTVVVMNAEGTRPVAATVSAGVTIPALGTAVTILLVLSGVGLVLAVVLLVASLRSAAAASPTRAS